jgi:hypothetical protein
MIKVWHHKRGPLWGVKQIQSEVQLLHADVVARSKQGDQCYTAKVIEGVHFVDEFPADKIYLHFNEVIHGNIFHVSTVSSALMRLWALDQASNPQLQHSNVALLDPYHMH